MTTGHDHGHEKEHGHGHGHGHAEHGFNAESLRNNDLLYAGVYRQALEWLDVPASAAAMEAGCGAGGFTQLLADAVVPHGGTVVAFDEAHEMLDATRELIESGPHAASVSYERGDIGAMPFDDGKFDLVWSSRTVHHLADQLAGVTELARTVRSGGKLALREGSIRTRFLPDDIGIGAPGLEDRLDVAFHKWFSASVRADGVRYPFGWTQMLRDAGLTDVTARTFMLEALPPFTDVQISYMGRHLRRWVDNDERKGMLAEGDAEVLTALLDPAAPSYVFKRPDLYLHEMVTVYVGTAP
jgi:ubiquinone/menaquinone biosynthesis C-methylase UbiE